MRNEDKLKLARLQKEKDITMLLISVNSKLQKLIDIAENDKIITVRGMAEMNQTMKNVLEKIDDNQLDNTN